MRAKLSLAMGCYAGLAGLALFTLTGLVRTAVLIFLAGLAIKTLVAARIKSL